MKKSTFNFFMAIAVSGILLFGISSCDKETTDDVIETLMGMGWFGDTENLNNLESDINLSSNTQLPESVNLLDKFPPIGNQGQYGTCVAWAVGYNLRSYMQAKDKGLSTSQLAQAGNQFSPKDLFWAIPTSKKGSNCNGTSFEAALDILVSRGVTNLSTASYTDLGDCSSAPPSSWTSDANNYKIDNYRKIDINIQTIKGYLAQKRPVVFGAKLGENFMGWNRDAVLTSDGDTYNGQHAYHAMILCGYDNAKGPNGAFRVVNSWGTQWGDRGYIWVDYNFFVNQFCFAAFVAKSLTENPDGDGDNNTDVTVNGYDLLGWELIDIDNPNNTDQRVRTIKYNVFNKGNQTIPASKDWNIVYIYYNAYNANQYGILLYDYYSDDFGTYGADGSLNDYPNAHAPGIGGSNANWWNYINVPAGQSVAQALYGGADSRFNWGYTMPSTVNGQYYLVLIADGYNVIEEDDETNNYVFFTKDNGDPITINNGIIDQTGITSKNLSKIVEKPGPMAKSPNPTTKSERNVNAYSPHEIRRMIEYHKKTGELDRKVKEFLKEKNEPKKKA